MSSVLSAILRRAKRSPALGATFVMPISSQVSYSQRTPSDGTESLAEKLTRVSRERYLFGQFASRNWNAVNEAMVERLEQRARDSAQPAERLAIIDRLEQQARDAGIPFCRSDAELIIRQLERRESPEELAQKLRLLTEHIHGQKPPLRSGPGENE